MRTKRPDTKNAISMIEAAERDIEFTLTLPVNDKSSATIVRNIYESFRMLGDSLLVIKGISSEDHVMPIKELTKLKLDTQRPVNLLDNMRRLRHNINYYGYKPREAEVNDAINLTKALFKPITEEIRKQIKDAQKINRK